jgi:putative oxidoreductase
MSQLTWLDLIGVCELLGAIGLILPSLLRVQPKLTGLSVIGVALIMLFALVFRISKGEISIIGMNVLLGLIAIFIAWGRLYKTPIQLK